ncbi:MAG: bifunctional DNA primase/polymerase [Gemmataceae bacterium]
MVSELSRDSNLFLSAALAYAARGWRILPLRDNSKVPRLSKWPEKATTDETTIRQWWTSWPEANLGLTCGPASNVLALDIDGQNGLEELARLEQVLGPLPRTVTSQTPSGGQHRLFLWPTGNKALGNRTRIDKLPIDVRAEGGQIVLPSSRTSKGVYRWLISPEECQLAELPAPWLERITGENEARPEPEMIRPTTSSNGPMVFTVGESGRPDAEARAIAYLQRCNPAISGQGGHAATLTVARAIVSGFDLGAQRGFDLLWQYWNPTCQPPWSKAELWHKCEEADRQPFDKPRGYLLAEDRGTPMITPTPMIQQVEGGQQDDIEAITLPEPAPWPALRPEALHGLAGEIIQAIAPHSEADPAGILGQLLAAFGNAVGRGPHFVVEGSRHYPNLFLAIVGNSSTARKGTSWGRVAQIMRVVDPDWFKTQIFGGLSSGEGLIDAVKDPITRINEEGELETVQEGADDKRAMVLESEFGQVLQQFKRQGNTLSAILRQAWDSGNLQTMTRNSKLRATDAHISIAGHITRQELERLLGEVELFNGFSNRFLWLLARRSQLLPEGSPGLELAPYIERLQQVLRKARTFEEMHRDDQARELWREVYPRLNEDRDGLFGAATSRAPAQVVRLSVLYALLDGSRTIRLPHLQAALALWDYCDASARIIFGAAPVDPLPGKVLEKLIAAGATGATRTDLQNAFHRNLIDKAIVNALGTLRDQGKAWCCREDSRGRPRERWYASEVVPPRRTNEESPTPRSGTSDLTSFVRTVASTSGAVAKVDEDLTSLVRTVIQHDDGTEEVEI